MTCVRWWRLAAEVGRIEGAVVLPVGDSVTVLVRRKRDAGRIDWVARRSLVAEGVQRVARLGFAIRIA
jgi:hypothetical protein